jgi:hypothetical protein
VPDPSPYVPGNAPGILDDWCGPVEYRYDGQVYADGIWGVDGWDENYIQSVRLDCRRPEVRDHCARWLAKVLGLPVGATSPGWECRPREGVSVAHWRLGPVNHTAIFPAGGLGWWDDGKCSYGRGGPDLSSISLDSPDRDALALAAVCRWAADEIRAGRLEVPHGRL